MGSPDLASLRARVKERVRKSGPKCGVCVLSRAIVDAVRQLHSEGLSYMAIAKTLQEDGVPVKGATYAKHFREHESSR